MGEKRFDVVLLDVGGVLTLHDPAATGDVLEPWIGVLPFHRFRRAHHLALHALEKPLLDSGDGFTVENLDWNVFRRAFAADLGVPEQHLDAAVAALGTVWSPLFWRARIEDSLAALWKLHELGIGLGIVSNASGQVPDMLRHQNICQVGPGAGVPVSVVIDSTIVGVAKPHPRIFDLAMEHFPAADRSRVAYVGDSAINDVQGALNADLVPLLLDPYDTYAAYAHERIRSLHDVVAMCGG